MLWLIQAGGAPSGFIALFGIMGLVAAVQFMRHPESRRLEYIQWMSRATAWSIGAGIAAALAAVFFNVPHRPEWAHGPDMHLIVMEGIAESMAPAILGCTLLSLIAFVTALGIRRMPRD